MLIPTDFDFRNVIVREVAAEGTDRVFAVRIVARLNFLDGVFLFDIEVVEAVRAVFVGFRFGDFDVIRAVPLVKFDGRSGNTGFTRVENAVVVAVFEDVPGDRAEFQLAEVVVVTVFAVTDVDVAEDVVRNDAAQRADVILTVRIIGGIENFAQFVGLFDELAEFAVLTVRTVEDELVSARRVDRLRFHQRLDDVSVGVDVDAPKFDFRRIGDAVPTFAVVFAVRVVAVFEDIPGDRPDQRLREIVVRRDVAPLHPVDLDAERVDLFAELAALRAEVEVGEAFRRFDVGLRNDFVLAGENIFGVKFVITVNVGRRRPGSPVFGDEGQLDVRERVVLAEVVIAVDVAVAVDVTADNDRFRRQVDLRVNAGAPNPFVIVAEVERKGFRVVSVAQRGGAFVLAVVIVDERAGPSFRLIVFGAKGRRNGRPGDSLNDGAAELAPFDDRVVVLLAAVDGRLIFVDVQRKDEIVARFEIRKRNRQRHAAVFDFVRIADALGRFDDGERNGAVNAGTVGRNVEEVFAVVERAVPVFIEVDRQRVERRRPGFSADPSDVKLVAERLDALFGVNNPDRDRVGGEQFAFFQLFKAAKAAVRFASNVVVLRTFAISAVFFERGVFDRAFLREERHLSAFRALNAENFFAFTQY